MSADSTPRLVGAQTSKSFSRMEDTSSSSFPRNRATAVEGILTQDVQAETSPLTPLDPDPLYGESDLFAKRDSIDLADGRLLGKPDASHSQLPYAADHFELPIELASLTDRLVIDLQISKVATQLIVIYYLFRFIASLSAKVYSTPPSIDKLSGLFQDFYVRAAAHISTHISTLASRLHRETLSSPSPPQISGKIQRDPLSKDQSKGSEKLTTDQQMLTAEEVAEKRRARKILQYKGHALEEAVERRACEAVYDKIWRHKNSLDEVRDEKLRSKTAALALVGIGLKDLGIKAWDLDGSEESEASKFLTSARESLIKMNDEKFPLGKLHHLTAAHKAIVDTLTIVLPSSSSADEILPTLIYILITTPAEGINIISNLLFIQRFRASSRLDGEAAYCLTNLEAAISFLENVDLNSLQTDQTQDGALNSPRIASNPTSIRHDAPSSKSPSTISPSSTASQLSFEVGKSDSGRRLMSNEGDPSPQRRLTNLLQPSAKVLGAANDAVRNTADQGFKNISNTLDNSFNFLFGRLREVQSRQNGEPNGISTLVPKTLDDARRLVTTSPILDETDGNVKAEDRLLGLIGGRMLSRQNSTGSSGNSGSGSKAISSSRETSIPPTPNSGSIFSYPANQLTTPPFGSMKSIGNTLNPLNHIPGMIRGFGRSAPDPSHDTVLTTNKPKSTESISSRSSTPAPQKTNTSTNVINTAEFKPPIKRFLEMSDAGELKMSDIPELLEDYKRLALFLKEPGTS
ncbi:VPS9 domain-containing protein [Histoplasma capsulatum]|uniref:VPS9 domain-containing protein n=1 Tax=Ajellomyces capsulatus TaxID=5037 RepID=A0A8A1MC61_AJECA|nr:VPS9 domain-containing protein [Histoplasma capsulatum]